MKLNKDSNSSDGTVKMQYIIILQSTTASDKLLHHPQQTDFKANSSLPNHLDHMKAAALLDYNLFLTSDFFSPLEHRLFKRNSFQTMCLNAL